MKTLVTLFFYLSIMTSNVFFVLESDKRIQEKALICQKDHKFNTAIAAMMAASDEMRKKPAMMTQVSRVPRPSHRFSANSAPAAVDTPLPPANR